MIGQRKHWLAAACFAGVTALAPSAAFADAVADFYKGKRVTVYVGYSAGGGYDLYARTIARHIGKHIPGKPDVIVKNRTGAGSLVLANELYNKMPRDGTVFGTIGRGIPMDPLFGHKKAKFDATKFTWLGSANNEVSLCVSWHKTAIKSADDMLKKKWIVGGVGAGSDTDIFALVINNTLGAKMKLVTGYPGGSDINLAIERGELDGRCGWSWSSIKSTGAKWLKEKKINLLIQMSTATHPELPNVPFVLDFAKTDRDRKILELIYARQVWGRPFMGPPGIPADRAKALQNAFMATFKDPEFQAEAKRSRLEITPVSGPALHKMMVDLYKTPKDLVQAASVAINYTKKTEIEKAVIPIETLMGKITAVKRGGRSITVEGSGKKQKVRVSGRRTAITVAGAKAKRKALKVGMNCELTYQGSAAKKFACQ